MIVPVRPATLADAAVIADLDGDVFADEAWSLAQVVEELTGYGRSGWVVDPCVVDPCVSEASWPHLHRRPATTSGEARTTAVDGYVITRTVGDVADLQRIAVAPGRRGNGIAGELLAAASAGVRAQGAERMLLEVAEDNAAARAFYARAGFVEIDRRPNYYRQTVAALVLAKELAQ